LKATHVLFIRACRGPGHDRRHPHHSHDLFYDIAIFFLLPVQYELEYTIFLVFLLLDHGGVVAIPLVLWDRWSVAVVLPRLLPLLRLCRWSPAAAAAAATSSELVLLLLGKEDDAARRGNPRPGRPVRRLFA